MAFCRYCGSALSGGVNFCPACGRASTRADTDTPVAADTATPAGRPEATARSVQTVARTLEQGAGALSSFRQGLMSPEAFLETARQLPWGRRPQAWWDMLAILGGAASGCLWFLYGSVRATQFGGWFTLALLLPPLLACLFKQQAARLASPIWARIQKWPLIGKIAGLAGLGIGLSAIPQREGLDFVSPLLMVAVPIVLVWFRPQIDRWLQGLRPLRDKLPLAVRVGMGLALPFVTAFILYNGLGFRMYPLMRVNTVVGTLLSYALIRTPASEGAGARTGPAALGKAGLWLLLLGVLQPATGWADDFLRDPFNLNDGLRTDGIAPLIAGAATAIVSVLVNGAPVVQTILQSLTPAPPGGSPTEGSGPAATETPQPPDPAQSPETPPTDSPGAPPEGDTPPTVPGDLPDPPDAGGASASPEGNPSDSPSDNPSESPDASPSGASDSSAAASSTSSGESSGESSGTSSGDSSGGSSISSSGESSEGSSCLSSDASSGGSGASDASTPGDSSSTFLGSVDSPQPGESSASLQPQFKLEVSTENDQTDLVPDGEDQVKILARIVSSVEGAAVSDAVDSVTFESEGANADWLTIGDSSTHGDTATVTVTAQPPEEGAEAAGDGTATVLVTAEIEEAKQTSRVTLNLLTYEVRFNPV